ncbi:MAG: dihydrolipoyl dehydrogenase [Alphaproteobacteria bacterium]|nr:MAG: dihydrolipoyl dehydrogenase [Alphaproteobacteria bacterium]
MADEFDLVVIGGGPGGYNCAIRAAQLGLTVACIDKRGTFGGTCLNVGCIPSKALLHASEVFEEAHHMGALGVKADKVSLDLPAMLGFKEKTVDELTKGIEFLFKKNKITGLKGTGKMLSATEVLFTSNEGEEKKLTAKNVVVATGSEVISLPGIEIDESRIVSSTGALSLEKVPGHLLVIGGGVIGLELGSVWRRLGAEVTVVEFLDHIGGEMDGEVSKTFLRALKKQGMKFKLSSKVTGVETSGKTLKVAVEPAKGGDAEEVEADVVLMCIGRKPFTAGVGLEDVGVMLDERGRIEVDGHYRTNVAGVYAIGDVIKGPMLAHKAEDESMAAAEIIAGKAGHVNYDVIPSVVYTNPEVAFVGMTEEQVKAAGIDYKVGKFPFTANAKAKVGGMTDGFAKIIADAKTDRVLGVHIVGPDAGNMIGEAAVAMEFGAAAEDIALTCHAHPTLSEAIRQAALGVDNRIMQM